MVLTNMKTFEKHMLPASKHYELMFSDNGGSAIVMGISTDGGDICKSDAEIFTNFLHVVHDREYMFDISTGANKELQTLTSRNRLALFPSISPIQVRTRWTFYLFECGGGG